MAEYLQGNHTLREVAEPHGVHPALLSQWVKKLSAEIEKAAGHQTPQFCPDQGQKQPKRKARRTGQATESQQVESEMQVLQKALEQERLKNQSLQALIDAAEEATGRPIRKKTGPGQ